LPITSQEATGDTVALQTVQITPGQGLRPADVLNRVAYQLGEDIRLLGYDWNPSGPTLTLYWRPDQPLATDYIVFVHLLDGQGQLVWGSDGPPLGGLAPVAVHPSRQARGIGAALIRTGLDGCRELGWRAIFLVGSPDYYARFGFTRAAPLGFSYGDPVFDAALQVAELEPGALAGARGRVQFHPAFSQTGTG